MQDLMLKFNERFDAFEKRFISGLQRLEKRVAKLEGKHDKLAVKVRSLGRRKTFRDAPQKPTAETKPRISEFKHCRVETHESQAHVQSYLTENSIVKEQTLRKICGRPDTKTPPRLFVEFVKKQYEGPNTYINIHLKGTRLWVFRNKQWEVQARPAQALRTCIENLWSTYCELCEDFLENHPDSCTLTEKYAESLQEPSKMTNEQFKSIVRKHGARAESLRKKSKL